MSGTNIDVCESCGKEAELEVVFDGLSGETVTWCSSCCQEDDE